VIQWRRKFGIFRYKSVLNFCSAATRQRRRNVCAVVPPTPPPSLVPCTNRPFGHQRRYTKRLSQFPPPITFPHVTPTHANPRKTGFGRLFSCQRTAFPSAHDTTFAPRTPAPPLEITIVEIRPPLLGLEFRVICYCLGLLGLGLGLWVWVSVWG